MIPVHLHPAVEVPTGGLQRQQAQMADRLGAEAPTHRSDPPSRAPKRSSADRCRAIGRNEFQSAQAAERSLAGALEAQKADALSLNRRGIEYGVLRREAESNKQMYETLMQRAKETGISGELKTSNIRM
jgi:uncharacterized protein involved in exopolysaccharide biosynthesis